MKPKHILLGSTSNFQTGFLKAMAITLCLAGADQAMAQRIWDGGGTDANWNTADNWDVNTVPSGNIGAVTFIGNNQNTSTNNVAGLTTAAFSFTNDGTAGKTNAFVLNGSNSLSLGAGSSMNTTTITNPLNAITDTINFNLFLANNINFNINSNHHLTINGNISQPLNVPRGITMQAAGTLTLSGDNQITGGHVINNGAISISAIADGGAFSNLGTGNLRIGNANIDGALIYTGSGSSTARTIQIGNGAGGGATGSATISANGSNGGSGLKFTAATFNTQVSDTTVGARTLTLSGSNTDENTISGKIVNIEAVGTITNLTKSGAGRWILGGANEYTGNTAVNGGTLVVNGSISTSLLTTVASGATIAGSGSTGALTISTGGTIAPGNSPGTLNVNGAYIQDGLYAAEINGLTAGTQHDQINVTGTVDITGATLSALFSGSYSPNDMIFILKNDSTDAISGTFTGLAQGATAATYGGFNWEISYIADSVGSTFTGGNDIALRAIPEPRAALLGGLGLLMLFRRRNR